MKHFLLIITLVLGIVLPITLSAQPAGTMDSSFGDNGKIILDNGGNDLFNDVKIQEDKKIVAIGISYDATFTGHGKVYRFLPDGTPDVDFATDGVFTFSLNYEANLFACAIKDDGKILLAGSTTDYNDYRILLMQLNTDGTFDSAFGDNGVVVQKIGPDMPNFEDHSYAITLQNDGMILLAGKSYNEEFKYQPVVVRFTENGVLDSTFGTNGVASIPVIENENDFDCLVVQEDGKIIASGHYANTFLSFAMLVVRFNPDGTVDPTFGDNGIVNYPYSGVDDEGFDLTLTPDNKVLIAGFTTTQDYNYSMLLVQLDQNGVLDLSFGTNGVVVSDMGQFDVGSAIQLQADQKILVGGSSGEGFPNGLNMAVWRYLPDGTPDNTFGTDGVAIISLEGFAADGLALTLQDDGKILLGGKGHNGSNQDFILLRLFNDVTTATSEKYEIQTAAIAPNPVSANSPLTINYELAKAGDIQLGIYNTLGSQVELLELGFQAQGSQSPVISIPPTVTPGAYYLRIIRDGVLDTTAKLVVID